MSLTTSVNFVASFSYNFLNKFLHCRYYARKEKNKKENKKIQKYITSYICTHFGAKEAYFFLLNMHKNVVSSYKHAQNCTIFFSFKDNMRRKGKTDFFF